MLDNFFNILMKNAGSHLQRHILLSLPSSFQWMKGLVLVLFLHSKSSFCFSLSLRFRETASPLSTPRRCRMSRVNLIRAKKRNIFVDFISLFFASVLNFFAPLDFKRFRSIELESDVTEKNPMVETVHWICLMPPTNQTIHQH